MPVRFLTFSIGIEDSIRDIELSPNKDVIDTLKELSLAARKKKTMSMVCHQTDIRILTFCTFIIFVLTTINLLNIVSRINFSKAART